MESIKNLETKVDNTFADREESITSKAPCKRCTNPVCIHNTTDDERAAFLSQYLDALPVDPLLLPRTEDGKKPIIAEKEIALDSDAGKNLLVSGEEAVRRIREDGATGFCLYAGKPSHNTEQLVFADHDDLDTFPLETLPDTLTARSGSSNGYHETFQNAGDVRNATGKGDMSGAGEIRAKNWFVVTPGSIHPSGGIYYTVTKRPLATLSSQQIPSELLKHSSGGGTNSDDLSVEEDELRELHSQVDTETVETGLEYLNEWKNDGHASAFYCLQDRLKGGRGDYASELSGEDGMIDRDLQEKAALTHLYGIYRTLGYSDNRAKELAYQVLSYYCIESNNGNSKDGQPRKWIKRGTDYRKTQLRYAATQFDRHEYERFCNKSTNATTRHKRRNNEYSEPTRGIALFAVDFLCGVHDNYSPEELHKYVIPDYGFSLTEDETRALVNGIERDHMYNDMPRPSSTEDIGHQAFYPRKTDVMNFCERVDRVYKGNQGSSFGECLNRLRGKGKVKMAEIENGMTYIYYPVDLPDPQGANWVKCEGERTELN